MAQLNIKNREIENEQFEFKTGDIVFLGPNLTLRNCTLVLKVAARDLILISPRLIDCTIHVKKELKNLRWYDAFLKGCRFTGLSTAASRIATSPAHSWTPAASSTAMPAP
jgi:hypothetical protein